MIYYRDDELTIRSMEEADARIFTDEEAAQGWNSDISKYLTRLRDQAEGKCISLTAVYRGHPAGYINVYLTGLGGAFSGKGLPEIVDFGVLEKYRRRGIGNKLMDAAEQIAGQYADTVHYLYTGDDAFAVTGNYGNMSVQESSAFLPHAYVSKLVHPAYRFSIVLDLKKSSDGLHYDQDEYYQKKNGYSREFHYISSCANKLSHFRCNHFNLYNSNYQELCSEHMS